MVLIYDKALVVRSSNSILFFKRTKGTKSEGAKWKIYHKLDDLRGELDFVRGGKVFQITTERKIYFYKLDKETLMPIQENVMYNFMNCSTILFSQTVAISYKAGQPDFQVFSRAHEHNFNVCI